MTYSLKDSDGFYSELENTYGINRTWVTFGSQGGPVHQVGHCIPGACSSGTDYQYVNIPEAVKSNQIDVTNPKDIITAAMPSTSTLQNNLLARELGINFGAWGGGMQDLLDTFSMPVFMLQQAITSMASVKAIGEKQAKEDKIKLVLEILGIAFAFIPFLDDIAPELELLDGAFETIAATGNVALGIQSIVSDPSSAPMVLLGLLGGGGLRDEDDLESIGKDFKAEQDKFDGLTEPKCRV